jgi:FkbM family methyltransferase
LNILITLLLTLVNLIVKKLFAERIYKKIFINPHNIYVRIHAKNYSFLYRSVAYDDLNMMCRENLKFWESSSREIFSELAKKSNFILDIGSYTGIYTLIASKSNKNVHTISFEPNPLIFRALEKNLRLNRIRNTKLEKLALDNESGKDYLYLNHEVYTSAASIIETNLNYRKYEIKKSTLDSYFEKNNYLSVDLIKIDVEGLETRILEGSRKVLYKFSPILLMEALTKKAQWDQMSFLKNLNYLEPLQVKGDGYDSNNWLWFTKKDLNRIKELRQYLILSDNSF